MQHLTAQQWSQPCTHHGEGAVWFPAAHGADARLRCVDMLAGDVLTFDADGGVVDRERIGTVAACVRPRRERGGYVAANERGFLLVDADGTRHHGGELWTDPSVRMNEGGADPDGRFYCGSMQVDGEPGRGTFYRFDVNGDVTEVFTGMSIPNGFVFSPDHAWAYHVDTPTQQIRRYRYVPGAPAVSSLRDGAAWVTVPTDAGSPDGAAVDAEGSVWVALHGGAAVHRYSPAGELQAVVEVPVAQPTSVAFGGATLDELFITTSRDGLDSPEPAAGAVFRVLPGVRGLPVLPYAG